MKSGDCIANKIRSGLWSGRPFLIVPRSGTPQFFTFLSYLLSESQKRRPKGGVFVIYMLCMSFNSSSNDMRPTFSLAAAAGLAASAA